MAAPNEKSELFLTARSDRVGKVAVEGEARVTDQRVNAVVNTFERLYALRNLLEQILKLRQVLQLDRNMNSPISAGPKPSFRGVSCQPSIKPADFR
jgi:hypothetical protein